MQSHVVSKPVRNYEGVASGCNLLGLWANRGALLDGDEQAFLRVGPFKRQLLQLADLELVSWRLH